MKKSWKTTLFGLLASAGAAFTQSDEPILKTIGSILMPVALALGGISSRDNDVSSEKAGAK